MRRFVFKVLLLGLLFACVAAQAGLVWRNAEQRRSVCVEQAKAVFFFNFRNAGAEPVEIVKVRKSCTCLSEQFDKSVYAPGESGVLTVAVDLNGRSGPLQKSLMITTSDQPETPKLIRLHVQVPQGYTMSSNRLVWEASDVEPKVCRMTNASENPVILKSIHSSSPSFNVELISVREGFEYDVRIEPRSDAVRDKAFITIQTDCPLGVDEPRAYTISVVLL